MQVKLILPALTEANNLVERPESRSQQLVNVENAPADHTV
jgi:hypothetical protein